MKKEFNIQDLVRENIKKLKPYKSARDEFTDFGKEMVFLDANENPFENGINRYPDPHQMKVKSLLSELKGVSQNQILLGNGSDEVLDLLFRAFCEPKIDNIITLPPTYGMYKVLADTNAVENREVLLTKDFQPDIERVLKTGDDQTKMIFLCSPNNPTGNSFSSDTIEQLLLNFQGLVVIDEAYIDFSKDESWLSRLDEFQNLVVTQTLSKAYGLAGIRLGVCYASEAIVSILKKIKPPYNVNELTQQKALERLQNQKVVIKEVEEILKERRMLKVQLGDIDFVEQVFESDANFILARVDDAEKRYDQLLNRGIVVRNRSTQPLCRNTLRFTIGTSGENKSLITELKNISVNG